MAYFSGQGRVYIGARDSAGNPAGLTFVGNVPELKVSLSVETLEHQEAQSGQRLTDLQLIKTKKGEFACTLEELSSGNLRSPSTATRPRWHRARSRARRCPTRSPRAASIRSRTRTSRRCRSRTGAARPSPASGAVSSARPARLGADPRRHDRRPLCRAIHRRLRLWGPRRARRCSPGRCPSAGSASRA